MKREAATVQNFKLLPGGQSMERAWKRANRKETQLQLLCFVAGWKVRTEGEVESSTVWCRSLGPDLKAARPPAPGGRARGHRHLPRPASQPRPLLREGTTGSQTAPAWNCQHRRRADRGGAAAICQTWLLASPRDARLGRIQSAATPRRPSCRTTTPRGNSIPSTPLRLRARRMNGTGASSRRVPHAGHDGRANRVLPDVEAFRHHDIAFAT
jgi:hypothetical protein